MWILDPQKDKSLSDWLWYGKWIWNSRVWRTPFASPEDGWTEDNIAQKSEDCAGVAGVTTEGTIQKGPVKKQSLIFGQPKEKITGHESVSFCKKPWSVVS